MSKSLRLSLLALVAASALTFAACSDDSGSSSAGTTASGGAATTGASSGATSTLDPIVGNVDLGPLAGCPFFTADDAKKFLGKDVGPVNMKGSQVDSGTILAVCAYNDTSGVPENGVSVSVKLAPMASSANVQGDLLDLEQNRFAGSHCKRSTASVTEPGPWSCRAATSRSWSSSPATTSSTSPLGPNQSLDQVVQLARDTLPKLPTS